MRPVEGIPIWARIALVSILILLLDIQPSPIALTNELTEAWEAWESGSALDVAHHIENAAEYHPQREILLKVAGLYALAGGDPISAIRLLEPSSMEEHVNPLYLTAIGDAYQMLSTRDEAIRYWTSALVVCAEIIGEGDHGSPISEKIPIPVGLLPLPEEWERLNPAHINLRLGRAYYELRNLTAAERYMKSWLDDNPGDSEAQYLMGLILSVSRPEAALYHLSLVMAADSEFEDRARGLYNTIDSSLSVSQPAYTAVVVGRELSKLDEWILAEMAFRQATTIDPGYADAWAFLGEARQQIGEEGLPELQTAFELNRDSIAVNTLLSLYWRRQGHFDQAMAYMLRAIEIDEGNPTLIAELGNLYAEAGNLPEAQSMYLQAIDLAPWDPTYWKLLAELSFMSQSSIRDQGLPAARQSLYLNRDDPYAMDLLGRMFMLLGDNITAERFFRKALYQDPGLVAARLHLGQVLLNQGELESAKIQIELAVQLGNGSEESQHAQRLLQTYFP